MTDLRRKPIHALIFLFRYRDSDQDDQKPESSHEHIWFANQIPEFACATVALLNIVNNIPDLDMGKELHDFKDFTANMDPLSRGDAIDTFEFAKRIHNSFARENDLLQADMYVKDKIEQARKKEATAKARATKQAKNEKQPLDEKSANITPNSRRTSSRSKALTVGDLRISPNGSHSGTKAVRSDEDPDGEFKPWNKGREDNEEENIPRPRRSDRAPKPRTNPPSTNATETDVNEEGFHFIAYMPVDNKVWKLDGLDQFPHSLGGFDTTTNCVEFSSSSWIDIARPAIVGRMAQFEGAEIEFNLMAVVHDPAVGDKKALLTNLKTLQAIEKKLDSTGTDWRLIEGTETKRGVVTSGSPDHGITEDDINDAELPNEVEGSLSTQGNLLKLIEMRKKIMEEQSILRAGVRDSLASSKDDEEKARHRRHDYGTFLRSWLHSLAENELLGDLLEG